MRPRPEDRSVTLEQVPARYCPRRLVVGQCKRYMTVGPLVAYVLACPGCGFVEMHQHEQAAFVEVDGKLIAASKAVTCMACQRIISIAGGVATAMSRVA